MAKIIVCGYGPVGKKVVEELSNGNGDFIAIDPEPTVFKNVDFPHLVGDATREEVLGNAGIQDAKTVIITTSNDALNSFIVLVARGMNPETRILSIVNKVDSIEKLYKAGADQVISEAVIGGRTIAKHAVSKQIGDFIDRITLTKNIEITEIKINQRSQINGRKLMDSEIRELSGATVLALKKGEHILVNPGASVVLEAGDSIVAIGSSEQIRILAKMARARLDQGSGQ